MFELLGIYVHEDCEGEVPSFKKLQWGEKNRALMGDNARSSHTDV
jgi:hypothetical protein